MIKKYSNHASRALIYELVIKLYKIGDLKIVNILSGSDLVHNFPDSTRQTPMKGDILPANIYNKCTGGLHQIVLHNVSCTFCIS